MATERWEILDASMLPPTTATEVQIVCPIVAPTATPSAFLCVASCKRKLEVIKNQMYKTNTEEIKRLPTKTKMEAMKSITKAEMSKRSFGGGGE